MDIFTPGLTGPQGPTGPTGPQGPTGASGSGTGDLLAANNLSDVANAGTARTNLGLGNVDNTADVSKPVSTAQAAANTAVQSYAIQRANHTGAQAISTVTGLQGALDGKASSGHTHAATDISDSTSAGRSVLTGTAAVGLAALGAEAALGNLTSLTTLAAPSYAVTANRTLTANLVVPATAALDFRNGAIVQGAAYTVSIFGFITAGRYPCFTGFSTGQIGFGTNVCEVVYPEWFGAKMDNSTDDRTAMLMALSVCNRLAVSLGNHTYRISDNLTNNVSYRGIHGKGRQVSFLAVDGTTTTGVQFVGSTGSPLRGCSVKGFNITHTGGASSTGGAGVVAQYTAVMKIHDMQVDDFLLGFAIKQATNTEMRDLSATFSGNANGFVGFTLDGGKLNGSDLEQGNASTVVQDCAASRSGGATGTGSIGLKMLGSYSGDIGIHRFDTSRTSIGIEIDLTGSTASSSGNADIWVREPHLDYFDTYGLFVHGNTDDRAMVTVDTGWYDPKPGTSPICLFAFQTRGVEIIAPQIGIGGTGLATGALIQQSKDCSIKGGNFRGQLLGVWFDASTDCALTSGATFFAPASAPATNFVKITGCQRITVSDIKFGTGAYCTTAVTLDATTSNCDISIPATDTTHITTLVSVAGTDNRIRVNGPATLVSDSGTRTQIWSDWTTYTPTVSAGSGSLGSAPPTATGSYKEAGDLRFYDVTVTFPAGYSAGSPTAAGYIGISLPSAPVANFDNGMGREIAVTGTMLQCIGFSGNAVARISKLTDSTFIGTNSHQLHVQFYARRA